MRNRGIAVVVGASGAIGTGIVQKLNAEGFACIAISSRGTCSAKAIHSFSADVTDFDQMRSLADHIIKTIGSPLILVNAAAAPGSSAPAEDFLQESWQTLIDVDLSGVMFSCVAFGRHMLTQGYGRVVNLSSFHSISTYPQRVGYAAVKAGVEGLTRGLAVEWGSRGVTVNAVAPGPVESPRTEGFLRADPNNLMGMISRTPTGRLATPEDVANAVNFLVSEESSHFTGQTLVVDGGWTKNGWWGNVAERP